MPEIRDASVLEAIATLQRKAYLDAGINPAQLSVRFAELKEQMGKFQDAHPNYLPSRTEVVERDPDLDFVELDFSRRFEVATPTPFQNPWSFAILSDYWEYHRRKLYRESTWKVILATAPTNNYNAIALASESDFGILIEDGLLHLARRACNDLAPLLYSRSGAGFLPKTDVQISQESAGDPTLRGVADTILGYVKDKPIITPPPVVDPVDDFAIRHMMFGGFLAFVLEHELYHLRKSRRGEEDTEFERAFAPVWKMFDLRLRDHLPDIPSETELRILLSAHREELWADAVAVSRVMLLGKIEGAVGPALLGALLFHYLAEGIRNARLVINDRGAFDSEATASEETLAAQALYLRETHPYPQSRRAGVYSILTRTAPHYREYLDAENARLAPLFDEIQRHIRSSVP